MLRVLILILLGVVIAAPLILWFRFGGLLQNATGFIAHTSCDEVYVSGLALDRVLSETILPVKGIGPLKPFLTLTADRSRGRVTAALFGVFRSTATYRRDFGCIVERGARQDPEPLPAIIDSQLPDPFPGLARAAVTPPTNARVAEAINHAFDNAPNGVKRHTRAVVVIQGGRIIAERYAPGIGPQTRLLAYSMTKSFTNTMLGVLVRQGKIDPRQPAPIREWSGQGDRRKAITIENLMRMTSGLAVKESNSGSDDVSRMIFAEQDMAGFAIRARLEVPPGTRYAYTSGDTLILCRIIRDALGGRAEDVLRFARSEIFEPLGIDDAILEFDSTGTPIGSTYLLATARDWGRLGLLYLHDGVINGRRILPQGWVQFSLTQTLDSEYGAGLRPLSIPATRRKFDMDGVPTDGFIAVGYQGQYTVVIPSRDLVVVRIGATQAPIGTADGVGMLVRELIAALDAPVE